MYFALMCSVDDLPFKGKELELENFHPPFVQQPARDRNRGDGLVIYINKKLCSYNEKVIDELSEISDFKVGEFIFIEISRENNKNIIIGNMYKSPSRAADPNNFLNRQELKLKLLEKCIRIKSLHFYEILMCRRKHILIFYKSMVLLP